MVYLCTDLIAALGAVVQTTRVGTAWSKISGLQAGLDFTGRLVLRDDHAARRGAALHQRETRVACLVRKQLAAASDSDREDLQPELVNEVVLQQSLDQRAAAVNLDFGTRFLLELADRLHNVSLQADSLFPVRCQGSVRCHVFGGVVG